MGHRGAILSATVFSEAPEPNATMGFSPLDTCMASPYEKCMRPCISPALSRTVLPVTYQEGLVGFSGVPSLILNGLAATDQGVDRVPPEPCR